jgi:UPF0716 family protein affecting phage T7 exclusion
MYLVFALAIVNGIIAGVGIQSFLSRKRSISTAADLAEFKAMARQQMYQALMQIVLLLSGLAIGTYGLLTDQIGLLLVIGLNAAVLIMGKAFTGMENRARSLPVNDPSLQEEYARVCVSWVKKPTPDF